MIRWPSVRSVCVCYVCAFTEPIAYWLTRCCRCPAVVFGSYRCHRRRRPAILVSIIVLSLILSSSIVVVPVVVLVFVEDDFDEICGRGGLCPRRGQWGIGERRARVVWWSEHRERGADDHDHEESRLAGGFGRHEQ